MKLTTVQYRKGRWSGGGPPSADGERTFVIAFGAKEFGVGDGPLGDLRAAYPTAAVLGCSTSGEIFDGAITDDSVAVAVGTFEEATVRTASASIGGAAGRTPDSFRAAADVGRRLAAPDLRAVFVLADGTAVAGTAVADGLTEAVGPDVIICGSLAGDGDRFESTWTLDADGPAPGQIVALGIYGETAVVTCGARGGWDKFGPQRLVTRAHENVLYELDGKPALQLYRDYLGDLADGLPQAGLHFPLSLDSEDDPADEGLVRTILAIDEEAQSVVFAGDIPEGSYARLMSANFDRLVEGAQIAGAEASASLVGRDGGDTLVLDVSCVGRRLVLGERSEEEVAASAEALPEDAQQIGLYSYGELSPTGAGVCRLHNQTMAVTTVSEDR